VGRIGILATLLALITAARCYSANWDAAVASLPFPQAATSAPASLASIGKSAAPSVPDTDFTKWFSTDPAVDPYDPAIWTAITAVAATAGNQAGWTAVCAKVGGAAGSDRTANPRLGALGCSDAPAVTALQQFAVDLLAAQASVALWIDHAPDASVPAITSRQAQVRMDCDTLVPGLGAAAVPPLSTACTGALNTAYLSGDGNTTFTALGDAYALIAGEIARQSPKVAQSPVYFDTKSK
jgi:hypothetical protein